MEVGKKRIRLRDGAFGPRVQCSMDEIRVRFFRLGYYFSGMEFANHRTEFWWISS